MKEPTIYEFTDYFGDTREVFIVRGEYSCGGLRAIFVGNFEGQWVEWLSLTALLNDLDGRHAYIDPNINKDEICAFLERNGLAKPTGKSITEAGIFVRREYPLYEFTDKFFDEAFVFAND